MDDLKVFQDLIRPKVEIEEVHMDEEGSDDSIQEEIQGGNPARDETQRGDDEAPDNVDGENVKQSSADVEKNFQFDEDDTKFGIEQLGTLLSAFLQDDSGRNVVDAIVQNSKWQRNICRALEKISTQLENRR